MKANYFKKEEHKLLCKRLKPNSHYKNKKNKKLWEEYYEKERRTMMYYGYKESYDIQRHNYIQLGWNW